MSNSKWGYYSFPDGFKELEVKGFRERASHGGADLQNVVNVLKMSGSEVDYDLADDLWEQYA